MPSILSVGIDAELLHRRRRWLEETGAKVISASPPEAFVLLPRARIDLLILCHTVSDDWVGALTSLLREQHRNAWALVLGRRHRQLAEEEARIVVLMEFAAQNLLVGTAQMLLHG